MLIRLLSLDCSEVEKINSVIMIVIFQNFSTIISALIIALIFEWKTALTAIVFFPLLILSYALGVDNEK